MTNDDAELLLSDALEGTATPEDLARIAADEELTRRLAVMRAASAAMRSLPPVDVDPARRDTAISAAMAEFRTTSGLSAGTAATTQQSVPDTSGTPAAVGDLAAARARKRGRRLNTVLAAAASVAVVAAIGVSLNNNRSGDDDTADGADEIAAETMAADSDASDEAGEMSAAEAPQAAEEESSIGGGLSQDALADAEQEEQAAAADSSASVMMDDEAADRAEADDAAAEELEADESAEPAPLSPATIAIQDCRGVLDDVLDPDAVLIEPKSLTPVPDPPLVAVELIGADGSTTPLLLNPITCELEAPAS